MRTGGTVLPEDVGERIKEQRILNALTQKDLAAMAGLTNETISRLEAGKHPPSPTTLRKIANALNLPVQFFTRPQDDRGL
jgi:transcriptional regulator with XRE-family HTH domain